MRGTICITFILFMASAHQTTAQQLPRPYGELVWQDEFEGTSIDPKKWDRQEYNRRNNDNGPDGWWSKEDSFVDGEGNLVIRVRKIENKNDDNDPHDYSTAGIRTKGLFGQRYGRFEARCKLPKQQGWWVAFWMMQGNVGSTSNGGVDGSEVDIMEGFGWNDKINLAVHWDGYGDAHKSEGTKVDLPGDRNDFHTYTLDWFPEKYVFYIDGVEMWRTEGGGVCDQAGYIKLSGELSTVSSLSNQWWANDPEEATYPDSFFVDYVRVYKFPDAQAPFNAAPAALPGVIEAEQFDQGRARDAYEDKSDDNSGKVYRVGDVDVTSCGDGQYCITSTEAGEWLAYTVDANGTGTYDVKISYTAINEGAIELLYDDTPLGGEIILPPTGKNTTGLITVEKLKLKGGVHELKVRITKGGFQLDKLEFERKGISFF